MSVHHRHGLMIRRSRRAFTLVEILAVGAILSLVAGVAYKIFSGTFTNFFKSQNKLTNLRSASILLEHLKHDIRLSTIPSGPDAKPVMEGTKDKFTFKFQIFDTTRHMVTYTFEDGIVRREEEGKANRTISSAKVAQFSVTEIASDTNTKFLQVSIEVDDEMTEEKRSTSSRGNRVELSAILSPRFFKNFVDKEEEYWAKARQFVGGSP